MRVLRQMRGDKRTLALILFAPLLMFTLIFFLLSDSDYTPTIAAQRSQLPPQIVSAMEEDGVILLDLADLTYDSETQLLQDDTGIDMVVTRSGMKINTYSLENTLKSGQAMKALQAAMAALPQTVSIEQHVVYNDGASTFESLGFVFLSFLSFFFVFVISGMTLVRERTGGTLERLLMTPGEALAGDAGLYRGVWLFRGDPIGVDRDLCNVHPGYAQHGQHRADFYDYDYQCAGRCAVWRDGLNRGDIGNAGRTDDSRAGGATGVLLRSDTAGHHPVRAGKPELISFLCIIPLRPFAGC